MADSRFKKDDPPAPDFELFVGDKGGEIINGDVPIRWCITQEYIKKLEDEGIYDPHVLIASFAPRQKDEDENYYVEMDRKLIPLTELMTYLRFYRAGKSKIYALILDGSSGRGELYDFYIRRRNGKFNELISTYSDSLHDDLPNVVKALYEFVEIPAGVFGKEPSPWMKWYVNLWHEFNGKVLDECHYRRRWMIAFGFKWMLVIPFTLILIAGRLATSGFLALSGYWKKVNILRSFRPFKYPDIKWNIITDRIDIVDDNAFIFKRKNLTGNKFLSKTSPVLFGFAFSPLVLIIVAGVVSLLEPNGLVGFLVMEMIGVLPFLGILLFVDFVMSLSEILIKYEFGESLISTIERIVRSKWFKYFLIILLGVGIVILWKFLLSLIGAVLIFGTVFASFLGLGILFNSQIMRWILNKITISAEDNDYTNIKELLCPKEEDNLRPNIKYIPKSRRTIRLWYLDTKNKLCKPMQQ